MNGRIILSVIGSGLAATLAARGINSAVNSSVQWQKIAHACDDLGDFETDVHGHPMRCTGLKFLGTEDPARLSITGVVAEADQERIDARVEYLQPNGDTTTHTTDFRMLVLAVEENDPPNVSLVFQPGGGPDDPPGDALQPATYGFCHRSYSDDESPVIVGAPGVSVDLKMPENTRADASIHRFRSFGLKAGEPDWDKAFLTHDPKIVLRAKSGDETQQSPMPDGEAPTFEGHIECCLGMPLKEDCWCDAFGRVERKNDPRGSHRDNCDIKSKCIYNWDHNKGQYGCPP